MAGTLRKYSGKQAPIPWLPLAPKRFHSRLQRSVFGLVGPKQVLVAPHSSVLKRLSPFSLTTNNTRRRAFSSEGSETSHSSSNLPSLALSEFGLKDKVVVVSGAARGLGLIQASALLEAGATIYAVDRLPEPSSEFLQVQQHAAEKFGTELHYRQVDVRNVEELNDIVKVIGDDCGRLDGLVAAAGIQQETPALTFTAKDANTIFEVNITGVFMTAQAVARQMIRFGNGGSIVMIASMSGHVANRGLTCTAYNASKAGVLQLARSLASEWGEHGIRVNTISPGYIVTAMVEELFKKHPERRRDWPTQNMLGRLSTPEEYRGAAVFLISNASSFMTGADLRMDGGHTAW